MRIHFRINLLLRVSKTLCLALSVQFIKYTGNIFCLYDLKSRQEHSSTDEAHKVLLLFDFSPQFKKKISFHLFTRCLNL